LSVKAVLVPVKGAPDFPDGSKRGLQPPPAAAPLQERSKDSGLLSRVAGVQHNMAGAFARTVDDLFASRDGDGVATVDSVDNILMEDVIIQAPVTTPQRAQRQQQCHMDSLDQKLARGEKAIKKVPAKKTVPMDISSFLQTSGTLETRYLRMLSSLCSLTYRFDVLTPRNLYRMHQLELITSSKACEVPTIQSYVPSPQETMEDRDCRAGEVSRDTEWGLVSSLWEEDTQMPEHLGSLQGGFNNITPLGKDGLLSLSPVDQVSRRLGEAAAAAAALGGRAGAAVITIARAPFARSVAAQLEEAAQEGGQGAELAAAKARAAASSACPCEWFVADDPVSHTRYFVIQVGASPPGRPGSGSTVLSVTRNPAVCHCPCFLPLAHGCVKPTGLRQLGLVDHQCYLRPHTL